MQWAGVALMLCWSASALLAAASAAESAQAVLAVQHVENGTQTESTTPDLSPVSAYWHWLQLNGVDGLHNVALAAVPGKRFGVVAAVETPAAPGASAPVFVVPKHLAVTAAAVTDPANSAAGASAAGALLRAVMASGVALSDDVVLCVWLWYQRFHAPAGDPWRPWINVLPAEFPELPLFFNPAELAIASLGGVTAKSIRRLHRAAAGVQDTIVQYVLPRLPAGHTAPAPAQLQRQVAWALATLSSRLFGPRFPGDTRALVPLADMLNHGAGLPLSYIKAAGTADGHARLAAYSFVAAGPLRIGEELLTRYHDFSAPLCAVDALVSYGMVPPDAAGCVKLTLQFDPDAAVFGGLKAHLLQRAGVWNGHESVFSLRHHSNDDGGDFDSAVLPQELVTFARITQLGAHDLAMHDRALQGHAVSAANELRWLRMLRGVLTGMKRQFAAELEAAFRQGALPATPAEWSVNIRNIMDVHNRTVATIDAAVAEVDAKWAGLLTTGDFGDDGGCP